MPFPDPLRAATDAAGVNHYPAFPAEPQFQDNWCWAAVTAAILHWYGKPWALTQCDVVGVVLSDYLWSIGAPTACCPAGSNPAADAPFGIDKALQHPTNLCFRGWALLPLDFKSEVVPELEAGKPLVVQLHPVPGKPDHVILLTGYAVAADGKRYVRVDDPYPVGFGRRTEWEFSDFLAAYPIAGVFRTTKPV